MSEEVTKEQGDPRSFEERVFARFDALDARLSDLDNRIQKLETKQYDTKPIWERALKEILEVSRQLASMERKVDVLAKDMLTLRADHAEVENRLAKLEHSREGGILDVTM